MNIYVGNLPFSTNETQIRELFAKHGNVESVNLIKDRMTDRLRGFGFVEMDSEGAEKAIELINGTELDGRTLTVNQAKERESRDRRPRHSY